MEIPVTVPVEEPIVATPVLELVHVPPPIAATRLVVLPIQMMLVPVIADGVAFTVTTAVFTQLPAVYDMVTVPAATPVTTPVDEPTVAKPVLLLLHVPPVVAQASVVVAPSHTVSVPVIGNGFTLTFIVVVALVEPSETCIVNASEPAYPLVG